MSTCRRFSLAALGVALPALGLSLGARLPGWTLDDTLRGLLAGVGVGGLMVALLLWFTPGDVRDSAPPALRRRYYREFFPPMAAYVAVMLVWKRLLGAIDTPWLRVLVALLPAVLLVLVIRAVARYVRDSDEMQRRIELESVGIAAALTGVAYMTAGFLQIAGLIAVPATSAMLLVFPALCLGYAAARIVVARRFA